MGIKTIETIRRIRDEHYRQTKDLPLDERRAFYRKKSEEAMKKAKILTQQNKSKKH